MPIRRKAVTERLMLDHGQVAFDQVNEVVKVGPRVVSQRLFDRLYGEYDEKFEKMIRTIDWNRVLIEAQGRCLALDHEHLSRQTQQTRQTEELVCGESLEEALLAEDTFPDWKRRP